MTLTATSTNGITIRLSGERWQHILAGHGELAGMQQAVLETVTHPDRVLAGSAGERLAVRALETDKWLVVVYREGDEDGFIITALVTHRKQWLEKREQLWP